MLDLLKAAFMQLESPWKAAKHRFDPQDDVKSGSDPVLHWEEGRRMAAGDNVDAKSIIGKDAPNRGASLVLIS